jgi:hypothetical protein
VKFRNGDFDTLPVNAETVTLRGFAVAFVGLVLAILKLRVSRVPSSLTVDRLLAGSWAEPHSAVQNMV